MVKKRNEQVTVCETDRDKLIRITDHECPSDNNRLYEWQRCNSCDIPVEVIVHKKDYKEFLQNLLNNSDHIKNYWDEKCTKQVEHMEYVYKDEYEDGVEYMSEDEDGGYQIVEHTEIHAYRCTFSVPNHLEKHYRQYSYCFDGMAYILGYDDYYRNRDLWDWEDANDGNPRITYRDGWN